jgi:hypothetical protein
VGGGGVENSYFVNQRFGGFGSLSHIIKLNGTPCTTTHKLFNANDKSHNCKSHSSKSHRSKSNNCKFHNCKGHNQIYPTTTTTNPTTYSMQAQQLQVPKVKIPQPEQQIPQLVQVQQQAPVQQKREMMGLKGPPGQLILKVHFL